MSEDDKSTVVEPVETPAVETETPVETPVAVTPEERLANSQQALKDAINQGTAGNDERRMEIDLTPDDIDKKPEDKKPVEKPKAEEPEAEKVETVETEDKSDLQKEHDELKGKHGKLNDDYANHFNLINHASKHEPEIYERFLADIAGSFMKSKGMPGVDRKAKPTEPVKSPYEGQINPNTEEPYTPEEITHMESNFATIASSLGFVKQSDIQAEKDQEKAVAMQKTATKNIGDFKGKWEDSAKKMGLDWDSVVEPGMADILSRWGLQRGEFDKMTPENLSDAFNTFVMSQPNGMNLIVENAKAEALKTDKEKRNKGKVLPTKASKAVGDKGGKTFLEQFKDAPLDEKRRVAAKLIKEFNDSKGIANPIG